MGYFTYYILTFALAYATHHPAALGLLVVFYLCRGFLPDPVIWLRTAARMRSLRAQIEANPANVTARRDLARLYLQRLRPGRAAELLHEALRRTPDDAELLALSGLAYLKARKPEQALPPIVRAVEIAPNTLFGQPYLIAADALVALGRFEEAEDALERFLRYSSSSVEGYVKLARVRSRRGDGQSAREALAEGLSTWRQVPWFKKREQIGWWLAAQLNRLWI